MDVVRENKKLNRCVHNMVRRSSLWNNCIVGTPIPCRYLSFQNFRKKGGVPHFSLKKGGVGKIGVGGGGEGGCFKKRVVSLIFILTNPF